MSAISISSGHLAKQSVITKLPLIIQPMSFFSFILHIHMLSYMLLFDYKIISKKNKWIHAYWWHFGNKYVNKHFKSRKKIMHVMSSSSLRCFIYVVGFILIKSFFKLFTSWYHITSIKEYCKHSLQMLYCFSTEVKVPTLWSDCLCAKAWWSAVCKVKDYGQLAVDLSFLICIFS